MRCNKPATFAVVSPEIPQLLAEIARLTALLQEKTEELGLLEAENVRLENESAEFRQKLTAFYAKTGKPEPTTSQAVLDALKEIYKDRLEILPEAYDPPHDVRP